MLGFLLPRTFATAAALLPAVLWAADLPFIEHAVDSALGAPTGIYIAGVDGDGLKDIPGPAAYSAWWQNGGGAPSPTRLIAVAYPARNM
jgi:anti-sigma factor RsiW